MREGSKRQAVRACVLLAVCCAALPSGADDFQHELDAARIFQASARTPGDGKKVARVYERLVARYPKNAKAHSAYAGCLYQMNDAPGALAQWRAAEVLDPRDAGTASHLGCCYLERGESRKAVGYFALASGLEPGTAVYHYDLANATFILRHELSRAGGEQAVLENALAEFKKASELDPFNAEFARAYAETFYGLENPEWRDALKAWEHFLDLKGPPDFCYANMARVNLKLGRKEEALENLSRVTRSDFRNVKRRLLEEASKPD